MPDPLPRRAKIAKAKIAKTRITKARITKAGMIRAYAVALCALMLSSFSGCALSPSLSPRPVAGPWETTPTPPVQNALRPDAPAGRGWVLSHPSLRFGGFSGMTIPAPAPGDPPNGIPVLAVSDRGAVVRFSLRADGTPDPDWVPTVTPLLGPDGQALLKNRDRDAEEIVTLPDGTLLISFEQDHHLWAYPRGLTAPPVAVPLPSDFGTVPANGGLEAMAVNADGRLLLVQERHGIGPRGQPEIRAWVGTPQPDTPLHYQWQRRRIAPRGDFEVSGAATLPNGDVLLVERSWSFPLTFQTRLRRLDSSLWSDTASTPEKAGEDVSGTRKPLQGDPQSEAALLDGPDLFIPQPVEVQDNFESVVVLPSFLRADMDQHVLILSDNNFLSAQKTLLLDIGRLADLDGSQR